MNDDATELKAVIDWEHADIADGLPLTDILNASIFSRAEAQQVNVPTLIGQALAEGKTKFWDADILNSYTSAIECKISEQEFEAFLVLYWLNLISVRRTLGKSDALGERDWMSMYVKPAQSWLAQLIHQRTA